LESDLPALRQLADQIHAAIVDAAEWAGELLSFVESVSGDQVVEAYGSVMGEYSLASEYAERLPELLPDYDLRGAIIESCNYIRERASEAEAELDQKIQAIEAGEFTRGDIPAALKCAGF